MFAEVLEEDVAAKGHAGKEQRRVRESVLEMPDHEIEIGGFAGVIKPAGSVELISAGAKDQNNTAPLPSAGFAEQSLDIMGSDGALESVKKEQNGRPGGRIQMVQVEKISVRSLEPLDTGRVWGLPAEELSPQSLEVGAVKPPCR
jgi:hypothetical protein